MFRKIHYITGPNCSEPKIVLTTAGASMEEVTAGIANGLVRRISGRQSMVLMAIAIPIS